MILNIFPIAVFLRSIHNESRSIHGIFIISWSITVFLRSFYGIIAEFGMFTGFYEIYGDSISIE